MGKKVKEYKSGDFIFAKVKGYPAWPARVQKQNGKKYFVYFYGTGETANLPSNMIFDYAENKDKFLTKTVKRRDFNDGVKQIEHDFANNVPLEQVIGASAEAVPAEGANDTANDTGNDTMDDSAIDTTAADETAIDTTAGTQNATQNDTAVEDSDEAGALVIDEGKQPPQKQPRKSKAPEPAKTPKTPKTPRGRGKKEEDEEKPDEKEELVSRSGRKIRPKRYIDEQTEENATLPSPAPKKRRGASPPTATDKAEKEKEPPKEKKEDSKEKTTKQFNNVPQMELEDLKEPFKPADAEKENILIAYLPSGQYCGIKLFQSRPASFKDDAAKLQWDKQAAANAITLKTQLERGQITAQSIITQLVMDLNLTDEEKASLDKERETEEKKSRVQFLKTEMKLIELDAKIKTCLSLEKADVESCLKLLDELMELDIKPLMLLKHPCCVETVKRMRAYVGNAPRWQLSEPDALLFASRAHTVRKQADTLYRRLKELYPVPSGLSFWEHFSALLSQFQLVTASLSADQLLEMVRPPPELSQPSAMTMQSAIDAANKEEPPLEDDDMPLKKKNVKAKKPSNNTPAKQPPKRQSSRNHKQDEKEKETDKQKEKETDKQKEKETDKQKETDDKLTEDDKDEQQEPESREIQENNKDADETNETLKESADSTEKEVEEEPEKINDKEPDDEAMETNDMTDKKDADTNEAEKEQTEDKLEESDKKSPESDKKSQESDKKSQESDKKSQDTEKKSQESEKKSQNSDKKTQDNDKKSKESSKKTQDSEKKSRDGDKKSKESEKKSQENYKEKSSDVEKESNDHGRESRKDRKKELEDKQKEKEDEPRAKRSRGESKKTEPPPRSPAKRKSKM